MAEADSTCATSRCATCRLTKPAEQFHKSSHHKNGLSSRCRECQSAYNAAYRERQKLSPTRVSHSERAAAKAAAPDRLCPKCGVRKDRSAFGSDPSRKDGLRVWCRECHGQETSEWRANNPDRQRELVKRWAKKNPDRVAAKTRRHLEKHPGIGAMYAAQWRERNIDRARELARKHNRKRLSTVSGRLNCRVGNAVRACLGGLKGWRPTFSLLPYTSDELRLHIERQFHGRMDWPAFMRGEIHIDHIVPLASFKISGPDCDEFKRAWAITNLRPMWSKDNLRKSAKRLFLI